MAEAPPCRENRFRENRVLHALIAVWAAVWLAAAIAPKDRSDWLLENLLVLPLVAALALTWRRFAFSNLSYGLLAVFLGLHAIGAHYTYSETPIGDWVRDAFGLSRNHYDRFVHLAFGLLCAPPLLELARRAWSARGAWTWLLPGGAVLALSGLYELVEFWVARSVAPELGIEYLGMQGDVWDSQKDMTLALTGAVISLGVAALLRRR